MIPDIPYLSTTTNMAAPILSIHEAETVIDLCRRTPYPDYPCSMQALTLQLYREDMSNNEDLKHIPFLIFYQQLQDESLVHACLYEDYIKAEELYYWNHQGFLKLLSYITNEWNIGHKISSLFQKVFAFIEYRITETHAANILSHTKVPEQYTQLLRRLYFMELLFTWKSDLDDICRYSSTQNK